MISSVNIVGLALFALCLSCVSTEARTVNLTHLDNCLQHGQSRNAHLISVSYELDADTGICNTIHAKFNVTEIDTNPRIWKMTIFKCPADTTGFCNSNPTTHEELVDCKRFIEDDSGPWHMFSSSMSGSKCGEAIGTFSLDYSSLKLDHLVKYLDLDNRDYSRFRIEMDVLDAYSRETWTCGDMHFDLVDV